MVELAPMMARGGDAPPVLWIELSLSGFWNEITRPHPSHRSVGAPPLAVDRASSLTLLE